MSFAQSSAAEGIPVVLQNGEPGLHLYDSSVVAFITSTSFAASKILALGLPHGKYHFVGSVQVETSVAAVAAGLQIVYDGSAPVQMAISQPAGLMLSSLPISGAIVVADPTQSIIFQTYSASGNSRVDIVDLVFIRVA